MKASKAVGARKSAPGPEFPKLATLALVAVVVLMLVGLSGYPLFDPDEGRYAAIAQNIVSSGDWVTLRLGNAPYLDKPPLVHWMMATSLMIFGRHEWTFRLVPAVWGLLGMLVVWWLASLIVEPGPRRWTAVVMATTVEYFALARLPLTDMVLSTLLAATLTAWYASWLQPRRRWGWLLVSGVALGLALLTKGPMAAFLLVAIAGLHLLWTKRLAQGILPGLFVLIVGGLIAAPWFIAVQKANPDFNHYFFVVQHLQRFSGHDFGHHKEPFWYFFVMLPVGFALWTALWPAGLSRLGRKWRELSEQHRDAAKLLIVWAAFVFCFFSASSTKLVTYILPMWWPLAVGTALAGWNAFSRERLSSTVKAPLYLGALIVFLLGVGLVVYSGKQDLLPAELAKTPMTITGVVWALVGLGLWLVPARLGGADKRFFALTLLAVLWFAGLLPTFHTYAADQGIGRLLPPQLMGPLQQPNWQIAQYKCFNQSLEYYTLSRVKLIDSGGQAVGVARDDPEWFLQGEESIDKLSAAGPLALVTKEDEADRIAASHKLTVWKKNANRALLLNEAARALIPAPSP